ncbi:MULTISPECIES: hypothetical protein [Paenibacillus]|uniref:hypothetical protein n=1 Tax=Paenibacillus TaxID=44249 RepID=UPI0022B90824|nr:hypothetical protein [Paenibacillus caseinilyticus]MCZ8520777.1 hypothetical protein [Paenibacillus caseinilyticus]
MLNLYGITKALFLSCGRTLKRGTLMNICFYDNIELAVNEQSVVLIDRVYCLNFNEFIEDTWEQLKQVYLVLPQYLAESHPCSMWFGEEGVSTYHLYASVEPSGLQIVGELSMEQWELWESAFHAQLSRYSFPSFEC